MIHTSHCYTGLCIDRTDLRRDQRSARSAGRVVDRIFLLTSLWSGFLGPEKGVFGTASFLCCRELEVSLRLNGEKSFGAYPALVSQARPKPKVFAHEGDDPG